MSNNVTSGQKYRAVLDSIIPDSAKGSLKDLDSCYLSVSLETRPFRKPMLDATVEWIARHFKRCAVVVGDSIHRLTLQIIQNLSPEEAESEAYRLGRAFIEDNRELFSEHPGCEFKFVRCFSVQEGQDFAEYRTMLSELLGDDQQFTESIRRSATFFIDRRREDLKDSPATREKMIKLSCQYIIEEMAIFSCLVSAGWRVEVYPGRELPVLIEVAEGLHPRVPDVLKNRINVALKIIDT